MRLLIIAYSARPGHCLHVLWNLIFQPFLPTDIGAGAYRGSGAPRSDGGDNRRLS